MTLIDLNATSFVTPSVRKESRAKRDSMVLLENNEEVVYVHCKKKNKRSESPAAAKVAPAVAAVAKAPAEQLPAPAPQPGK